MAPGTLDRLPRYQQRRNIITLRAPPPSVHRLGSAVKGDPRNGADVQESPDQERRATSVDTTMDEERRVFVGTSPLECGALAAVQPSTSRSVSPSPEPAARHRIILMPRHRNVLRFTTVSHPPDEAPDPAPPASHLGDALLDTDPDEDSSFTRGVITKIRERFAGPITGRPRIVEPPLLTDLSPALTPRETFRVVVHRRASGCQFVVSTNGYEAFHVRCCATNVPLLSVLDWREVEHNQGSLDHIHGSFAVRAADGYIRIDVHISGNLGLLYRPLNRAKGLSLKITL
jgi:hypothetical protein